MTLIVVAEPTTRRTPRPARKTIGVLMHGHPSRAIVLTPREGGEFSGRVFAECWMPFGGQQQICAEGIEITADSEQTDEVARLLVPLIAPDLPVVLWCRGPRAFLDRSLDPLFPLANKIIFNTRAVRHASSAIEFLRRMHKDGRQVADLAWTRLTGWREAVAHLMDACAGGWLAAARRRRSASNMAAAVREPGLCISRAGSSAPFPGLNVTLIAGCGRTRGALGGVPGCGRGDVRSASARGSSLEVRTAERSYSAVLPADSEECLMREELSILGRDPVFDRVLG